MPFGRPVAIALAALAAWLAAAGADDGRPVSPEPPFALVKVVDGPVEPVNVVHAGDGSGRMFVVERPGAVRAITDGRLPPEPILDITILIRRVRPEQGLLGLAFDPGFAAN